MLTWTSSGGCLIWILNPQALSSTKHHNEVLFFFSFFFSRDTAKGYQRKKEKDVRHFEKQNAWPFCKGKVPLHKWFQKPKCLSQSFLGKEIFCFITCPPKQTLEVLSECGVEKGLHLKMVNLQEFVWGVEGRGGDGRDEWGKKPLQKLKQESRWRVLDDDCEHWPLRLTVVRKLHRPSCEAVNEFIPPAAVVPKGKKKRHPWVIRESWIPICA